MRTLSYMFCIAFIVFGIIALGLESPATAIVSWIWAGATALLDLV